MKKKELIDEVERHGYRLNSHHRLLKQLLEKNKQLEERIENLSKNKTKCQRLIP